MHNRISSCFFKALYAFGKAFLKTLVIRRSAVRFIYDVYGTCLHHGIFIVMLNGKIDYRHRISWGKAYDVVVHIVLAIAVEKNIVGRKGSDAFSAVAKAG